MTGYSFLALSMPFAAPPSNGAVSFGFMAGIFAVAAGKATLFELGATAALFEGGAAAGLTEGGATATLSEGGSAAALTEGGATAKLFEDPC